MNILPGEPVPPGFEDEINRVAAIQKTLDQYDAKALIGITYTLEMFEDDRHEPGYLCTLCDKRGDPRTIISHWTSFNHRMKYLERHFPTAVREFNSIRYKPNSHLIVNQIVQGLSKAIEEHHGRGRLTVYSADDFRRQKTKVLQEINNKIHFDERNGPNFLNCIDRSLWERVKPGTIAAPPLSQTGGVQQKSVKNKREHGSEGLDEISSDSDTESNSKKSKISSNGNSTDLKLPTPKELSLQASHIAQERYKWEKYRCMLEIQLNQMTKIQQEYEVNPEKHPLYPEEWKKFWNQRYKELQAAGKIDPNKYDYKPEWIEYWTKRMKKLFDDDVEKKKKEIKIKLGLPEHAEEKVEQLKERYRVQVGGNRPSGNSKNNIDSEVIDISDEETNSREISSRRRSRTPTRSRSRRHSYSSSPSPQRDRERERTYARSRRSRSKSPPIEYYQRQRAAQRQQMEMEYMSHGRSHYASSSSVPYGGGSYRVLDSHQMPKYVHSPSAHSSSAGNMQQSAEGRGVEPPEDDGPLTVVSVLRLVIALEEHLGSLGHKVVDMLGKALALEKVKANSSDDLLLNEDHVVFFETIKEKLKGLLIADVIEDSQKVRAVKKAIRNIATIIHQVANSAKAKSVNNNDQDNGMGANHAGSNKHGISGNSGSSQANTDLPFDRQLIVSKLAAALVIQGREDITSDQMDRLIQMFLLMVKLNKARLESEGKPMRIYDVATELGLPTRAPVSSNLDVNEVSNITPSGGDNSRSNDAFEKDIEQKADSSSSNGNSSMLESLTDSDLQTLLQNFKHLSHEEQHHLIVHLKKLETVDPPRVEKLRKYVNLADVSGDSVDNANIDESESIMKRANNSRHLDDSPPGTSNRRSGYSDDEADEGASIGTRRNIPTTNINLTHDDDEDDDDYNFEEVFKAASSVRSDDTTHSSKTKSKETIVPGSSSPSALTFKSSSFNVNLSDTQNLIANLMGSIQQSNAASNSAKASTSAGAAMSKTISPALQGRQVQNQATTKPMQQAPVAVPQQQAVMGQPAIVPQQPYFQQAAGYTGGYDQQNMAAYNYMGAGGYANPAAAYAGAQQGYGQPWGVNPQQQWQNFGMPNMQPQQQQQQQQPQPQQPQVPGSYNMFGRGPN